MKKLIFRFFYYVRLKNFRKTKKKVENFCEKNVEKHVVKCMGIFTSPRGDPYENHQKSPKMPKKSILGRVLDAPFFEGGFGEGFGRIFGGFGEDFCRILEANLDRCLF